MPLLLGDPDAGLSKGVPQYLGTEEPGDHYQVLKPEPIPELHKGGWRAQQRVPLPYSAPQPSQDGSLPLSMAPAGLCSSPLWLGQLIQASLQKQKVVGTTGIWRGQDGVLGASTGIGQHFWSPWCLGCVLCILCKRRLIMVPVS